MEREIKVSIIVPVHNVSKYMDNCFQSLLAQTLEDIEIICVDDGSIDGCRSIIESYAKKDTRIKPILLQENKGTLVARKEGVLRAEGKYILFCNSDDQLYPNAAQIVWDEMNKNPVDILQFSTEIIYNKEYSTEPEDDLSKLLKPCLKTIQGDICEVCFHKKQFGYTLWNKAYSTDLCKLVFSMMENEYAIIAEDLYTFFVVSYFAKSSRGIKQKLYKYNFCTSITGNQHLGYGEFEKQCNALQIIPLIEKFLKEKSAVEKYYTICHEIKNSIVEGLIHQWRNNLSLSKSGKGYNVLLKTLGASTFVSELAKKYEHDQLEIIKRLPVNKNHLRKGKKVKRIGVYYHRLKNGGTEKIIAELIGKWKILGYEITLFTDEEPSEDDYCVPEDIERIVLPSFLTSVGEKYKKRARYWEAIIKKRNIDTIIYNSPMSHILLWDTCLLKGLGCNFVIETHCMFSGAMWYSPMYACFLPLIYRMVDCVVSLSRVDIAFWRNYCPVYYIQNPIEIIKRDQMASLDSKNIIWVGRIAEEKQPEAVLEAFKIVAEKIPEATLTMVGSGDSKESLNKLVGKAKELNIYRRVEFTGFHLDVSAYYKNASVFAFTSMCEAAPIVLSESKSYGIPIVMFDLPNVEFARDSRGVIKVPQMDVWAMANELIDLLEDDQKRKKIGSAGRKSIEEFAKFDIEKAWKTLFYDMENGMEFTPDEDNAIMLDLLFQNMFRGLNLISSAGAVYGGNATCGVHEEVLNRHEEVVNRHEEVVNRHEEVVNRHEEVVNRHEEVVNRHEEVLNRHEEVVNRHEEVLNRHEETVNCHEDSINHQWEVQKWHEERLRVLEDRIPLWKLIIRKVHGLF